MAEQNFQTLTDIVEKFLKPYDNKTFTRKVQNKIIPAMFAQLEEEFTRLGYRQPNTGGG